MKVLSIVIAIILSTGFSVKGQTNSSLDSPKRIDSSSKMLVVVDGFKTEIKYVIVDPNSIEAINVINSSAALVKFGEDGKNGAAIITLKKSIKLLQIKEILDKYNLSQYGNKLEVCINKALMQEPNLILIEDKEIINVEIATERNGVDTKAAKSTEKFINIIVQKKN